MPSRSGISRTRIYRDTVSAGRFGVLPAIATGANVDISSASQPLPFADENGPRSTKAVSGVDDA